MRSWPGRLSKRTRWTLAAVGFLIAAAGAGACVAAEVGAVVVSHSGNAFNIAFDAVVDAPATGVHAVLGDYARLGKLNPVITAISVESVPGARAERVRSVLKACIWFFCREIIQVEDVTRPDPDTIRASIVPGEGDFESGSCFWRVTGDGPRTRLHYEATRVAAFWIPPLIGPWAIERTLYQQLESSIALLERLANQTPR